MWGDVPESRWFENCPHLQVCETEHECELRHLDCQCPVAHEQATECAGWLRENHLDDEDRSENDE